MLRDFCIPQEIVDLLVQWNDLQSIVFNLSEADLMFKPRGALKFLQVAMQLYKYVKNSSNAQFVFDVNVFDAEGEMGAGGGGSAADQDTENEMGDIELEIQDMGFDAADDGDGDA